jgi:hypothetical protein
MHFFNEIVAKDLDLLVHDGGLCGCCRGVVAETTSEVEVLPGVGLVRLHSSLRVLATVDVAVGLLAVVLVYVGDHVVVIVVVGALDHLAFCVDDLSAPAPVGNIFPIPVVRLLLVPVG